MKTKVSIFTLVYNQEQYIAQTIDSFLTQKTNFNYQIVIGEDYSTDKTRQICEDYQKKHPERIKLLPSLSKNIGLISNYMRTIKACDGEYIAICDGDDYWIDEYKLQKQVNFLDNNPDYSIVGTNYMKLYKDNRLVEDKKDRKKAYYEFNDLIFKNLIPSVTALFRNVPMKDPLPNWILNFPYGDWPTYLWVLKNGGKIHFLEDVTAVYRMEIGVSAKIRKTLSDIENVNLNILKYIASDNNFLHKNDIIQTSIKQTKKSILAEYNREKKYLKGLKLFIQILIQQKYKFTFIKFYTYSLLKSIK
ncbi:glycosyltransferase [Flaviramulus sp. BrNp1-15]|uniref:glycosyltransferase n=1 Tax=Flaviramulus sp. BrNp1-15 TaxID=2916754 RepID=UPI001EE9184F|nr:glycosyltransferase [Flaviramulus sp. BrNp1-15]ULC60572.1 glycosyltransferase [Flaviramulus sp. BrNp1-15]